MKLLFLVRHAKSSWDDTQLDDHERPLSNRGLKNIPKMIHRLNGWVLGPQLILTSTALRASQTAFHFSEELDCKPKLEARSELYTESPLELMDVIHHAPDTVDRLMLVGHNPAVTQLGQMFGLEADNIPTCGIAVFRFDADCWQAVAESQGKCYFFDYPKRRRGDDLLLESEGE
ncbi:hypothetical protein ABT56_17900 [Photobacterium aquae]|uniref:Phosphohistidine phosphatase n=1 Tax=Photobacterium aquae TaxID=1195763 RepID=A0A0J1GVM4_9GAMM|nr:histidine phosphatase family protein [Photobacterium aquae]KLV03691.1 hypothetical protein ABT56_17900 [Photobacterium aquae]